MPLEASVDVFIAQLAVQSPHTRAGYRRDLEKFSEYCRDIGIQCWAEVDAGHIRDYVSCRHRNGLAPRSLQRNLASIRKFFEYLQLQGTLPANPAKSVKAPKVRRRLPQVLDVDQAARLVTVHPEDRLSCRDRALLELTYSSGLRVSEVVGLNLDALDLGLAEVRVLGKGNKVRVVPVGSKAILALQRWLELRPDIAQADEQAVFVGRNGQRLSTRAVQLRFRRWGLRQGLETRVHPHMLRHSFASHVLESSGDLRAVQELLGHADIRTTQVYTHLDFQHLAKVYDAAHPRARRKRDAGNGD